MSEASALGAGRYRDRQKLRAKRERYNHARRGQPADPARQSLMAFWNEIRDAIGLSPIAPNCPRGRRAP